MEGLQPGPSLVPEGAVTITREQLTCLHEWEVTKDRPMVCTRCDVRAADLLDLVEKHETLRKYAGLVLPQDNQRSDYLMELRRKGLSA